MEEGMLKECPFCGGKAKLSNRLVVEGTQVKTVYHIYCTKCLVATAEHDTEYGAIAAWNMRHTPESLQSQN